MLSRLHGVPIELGVEGGVVSAKDARRDEAILRIADEALHNALRHAGASKIVVRLEQSDGRMVVEVKDDGAGFDPGEARLRSRHLGLTSMEERAHELGGQLSILSAPGAGTTVLLEIQEDG